MAKPKKTLPDFETEAEERSFWESHDSAEYVDWEKAVPVRFSEPETLDHHDIDPSAHRVAGADQD